MIWKIYNLNHKVMHEVEAETFLKAVEQKHANLCSADLCRADLCRADLCRADLYGANLCGANLHGADLRGANLCGANLCRADLHGADLHGADLRGANLCGANLCRADLCRADLCRADLCRADLCGADLYGANLRGADLHGADLHGANLRRADLTDVKNLVKLMGIIPGNSYYKRFNNDLCNNGFQFYVGLNELRKGEDFASDERVACSYPGFHFASKSWCAVNYPDRPLEALIRIPLDAQINEPWTTDGKASADKIEILKIWDTKTGKDVTDKYRWREKK
jgi:uncharacterized protein YjbI with pentapeptide repeats